MDRRFLLKAGGAALTAPFLRMPTAHAAGAAVPKRFVLFHHGQGTSLPYFAPTGAGASFTLPYILEPLAHLTDRMAILTGIDNRMPNYNSAGNAHENANYTVFSGRPYLSQDPTNLTVGGPTIDQVLTDRLAAPTPFPRLDLVIGGSVSNGVTRTHRLFAGPHDPISGYNDPTVALLRIFGDGTLSPEDAWALRARRSGVLDAVLQNFQRYRSQVPAHQRERLDQHMARVESLEARIRAGVGDCERPNIVVPPGYDASYDDAVTAPLMADLAVSALACDYTRVATISFANDHDHAFPWLWSENGGPIVNTAQFDNWHAMVHADHQPGMEVVYRWYIQEFADFLDKMAATTDADGDNLLDTSVVLYMPEYGSGRHWHKAIPAIVAGCVAGAGQYFDFMGATREAFLAGNYYSGDSEATTNQLFVSLLQTFGQSDSTFGHTPAELPTGGLPGVFG